MSNHAEIHRSPFLKKQSSSFVVTVLLAYVGDTRWLVEQRLVWVDVRLEVSKAPSLHIPGEFLPPSLSPASTDPMWHQPLSCQLCSINRVKAPHTHTYTQTTYQDPAIPSALLVCSGQLCLCQSLVPAAEVTLPKREREQAFLNEALWWLRGACAHGVCECMCTCITARDCWCGMIHPSIMIYHVCPWQSFSLLKDFPLQPFPSHRLSKFQCF